MFLRLAALVALLSTCVFSQSVAGLGGISGTVSDATGARIPDALVSVVNPERGVNRVLNTNAQGIFNVGSLAPGAGYQVRVSKSGFSSVLSRDLTLEVGQILDLSLVLQVNTAATEINVTAEAPVVDSQKSGVSQVVTQEQIDNLPINGRRVDSFVLLTPGVTNDGTFGLVSFRGVPGGNAFLTDGNDSTQQFYNENAGRTRISANISQDAVQEFQVLTGGTAEFGRASGGVINTVSKSGGNTLHGTAYWFYRDQNFNARDRYASFNPKEQRQQFGGSLSGPVKKDKLFYFFNTELTRRDFPIVSSHTFQPLFNSQGDFIAACTATAAQCSAARTFLDRFRKEVPRTANQELLFGKLDYRLSEKNSLSVSFNYLRWLSPSGIQSAATLNNGAALGNNGLSTVMTRNGRVAWTNLPSAATVNEFRFGWFKDRLYDALDPTLNPPGGFTGTLTINGVSNLGTPNYLPRVLPSEDRFQFADNLSWAVGRHIFKFGVDTAQTRDIVDQLINDRGSWTYPNFTAFAQDFSDNPGGAKRWQTFSQTFGTPKSSVWIRDYNFFAQDQWRASARLTLNYGLRYEFSTFTQPTQAVTGFPLTGKIPEPRRNFAPRFGIAYTLIPDKTILRASWGMFYSRIPAGLISNLNTVNFQQRSVTLQSNRPADLTAGPVWPNPLTGLGNLAGAGSVSISMVGEKFRTPYTMQGDISLEQAIGRRNSLTLSWAFNRGLRMLNIYDANLGPATGSATYNILDASNAVVGTYSTPTYLLANRLNPVWQRINIIEGVGNLWYNALLVQFRNRSLRAGPLTLNGSISYTWAHSIDENLGGGGSNVFFSGGPNTLVNGDFRGEKGSSSLDQRHRLVVGEMIQINPNKKTDPFNRLIVNNWQLSILGTFASSFANTPTYTVQGTPFPGAAFNGTLNGSGGDNRVPFLPRNFLDIDQVRRVDARIAKILRFNERYSLTANFEAFNVFNTPADTSRRAQMYQLVTGSLRPIANYGEGSASGGFPDGTNVRRMQVSLRFSF